MGEEVGFEKPPAKRKKVDEKPNATTTFQLTFQQRPVRTDKKPVALRKVPKPAVSTSEENWLYLDKRENVQGPFTTSNMRQWYKKGHLYPDLPIKLYVPNE